MNHAKELNKLIELSTRRSDFKPQGFRSFEQESSQQLSKSLTAANLFFSSSVLGLEAISHVIEDQAIHIGGEYTFYADFQKLSRLKPQQDRYRKLCESANPITIFGIPDNQPALNYPNLRMVGLSDPYNTKEPSLSQNWFVIMNNPKFVSMALLANELPSPDLRFNTPHPKKLIYRNFEGFWTYNQEIIDEIVVILEDFAARGVQPAFFD